MDILIENRHPHIQPPMTQLETTTTAILNALDFPDAELSIVLVDDDRMQQLNRDYRGLDKPTNVLAFSMREGEFSDVSPHVLGDVVISLDTVQVEAADNGVPPSAHLFRMLIHGILHLAGHDHEQSREAEEEMHARTDALLAAISPIPTVLHPSPPETREQTQ